MREVPVAPVGHVGEKVYEQLAAALRSQRTLGDVLAWGRAQSPARSVTEIITQDEYTHDIVIAVDAPHYLVFDTT